MSMIEHVPGTALSAHHRKKRKECYFAWCLHIPISPKEYSRLLDGTGIKAHNTAPKLRVNKSTPPQTNKQTNAQVHCFL